MSERSARYKASDAAKAILPQDLILEFVQKTVDKIYDNNMNLGDRVFTQRYNLFTVDGVIANGEKLLQACVDRPESIQQVLPVALVIEHKGEDLCFLTLQSEIGKPLPNGKEMPSVMQEALENLAKKPPIFTVKDLIALAKTESTRESN